MKSTLLTKMISCIAFGLLSSTVFAAPTCPATQPSFALGGGPGGAHYVINIELTGSKVIKGKKGAKDQTECSYRGEKWAHYSMQSPSEVYLGAYTYKKYYTH